MSKMISQEEFEHEIFMLSGNEYTVIGRYTGCVNKVDILHNVCGKIYGARLPNFRRGQRCPHCSGNYKKNHSMFIQQLNDIHKGRIDCLDEYKNTHKKLRFKCKICNHVWVAEPKTLVCKQRTGCPNCYGNVKRTHEQFCSEVYRINKDIEILSNYDGMQNKVDCRCVICSNEWQPYANALLKGCGCPVCVSSKGERRIRNYLVENGIRFEQQKEYPKLVGVHGGNLRFDFFIPDVGTNGLLLEYQGEQHEKPIDFNGFGAAASKEIFDTMCEHDNRKFEYAKHHKIDFLEIWYYDYNIIEKILDANIKRKTKY